MVCGTGAVGVETNENRVLNLIHPYRILSYSKISIIIAIAKDSDCFFVLLRFGYPHILFFISVWPRMRRVVCRARVSGQVAPNDR